MPGPALTPQIAVDHLDELSGDIRAAVLIDASGTVVAHTGDDARAARLASLASELFERADGASRRTGTDVAQVEVSTTRGAVFALRDPRPGAGRGWTIAVVARRFALPSLMFYDLLRLLSDIEPEPE